MADKTYHQQQEIKNIEILRSLLAEMPKYVSTFIRGIENKTAPRTRMEYARDLKSFFLFLCETNPVLKGKTPKDIPLDFINHLDSEDIEEYLEYIKLYSKNGEQITNKERALKRKLTTIRVFFNYLYKNDKIDSNPALKVDMPKLHDKAIVRLEANEVANFLDNVEYGNQLTEKQLQFHEKTKKRDLALLTLMLATGIRVTECVGLDINDVDFDNERIKVTRKGGYEAFVYFSEEAADALAEYIEERKKITAKEGHENALFLSSQKTRLTVRSVEYLVKKYAAPVTPLKKITPHKLRSTYGTSLYQETGDIYLVADVLGHKDVNTTRRHYADIENERRRNARNKVQLREKQ